MPAPKRTLEEETERLVTKMVRAAQRRRKVATADGKTRYEEPGILDQVRAAQTSLAYLIAKNNKLPKEEQENEFARQLREFHGEGKGDGAPATPNGTRGAEH